MIKYDKKQRNKIYIRDKFTCRVCGKGAGHIHHIIYRSHSGSNDERNLIALCSRCHTRCHNDESKWREILLNMQYEIYGRFDIRVIKKQDRYINFKFRK